MSYREQNLRLESNKVGIVFGGQIRKNILRKGEIRISLKITAIWHSQAAKPQNMKIIKLSSWCKSVEQPKAPLARSESIDHVQDLITPLRPSLYFLDIISQ